MNGFPLFLLSLLSLATGAGLAELKYRWERRKRDRFFKEP